MNRLTFTLFFMLTVLVASLAPTNTLACSYFDDEAMITQKNACEEDGSKKWSCDLNRCVTTQESKAARDDYLACATIENGDERKKCHDDYAKKYVGDLKDKEAPHTLAASVNGVFTGLMAIASFSKSQTGGTCYSKWIVLGTGAVGIVSELYFRFWASKELEDLRKNYKKENNEDPYFSQLRALEYLKQEQEAMAKMAGNRKKAYMLMTAGYTVGFAAALMESFKQPPSCGGEEEQNSETADNNSQPANTDASGTAGANNAPNPAPETPTTGSTATNANAPADAPTDAPTDGGGLAGGAAALGSMMGHPAGVAVVAGVGAALSGYMWKASADQESQSKENAEQVQAMIDQFKGTMAGFCPQGREDYNNPRCYCYNADGSKNTNRTRSETCQALWAQDEKNLFVAGTNYGANAAISTKGCMTVNGKYDRQCACKKLKNNKGENACMKVPATASTISGVQSALSTASLAKNMNGITNGEFSAADLNAQDLAKLAARANKARGQIELKVNDRLKRQNKPTFPKLTNSFVDKVLRATPRSVRDNMMANYAPIDLRSARPEDDTFKEVLNKAVGEGNIQDTTIKGGEGIHSGKKSNGSGFQLNLGDSGASGNKVENFMEKEYKMNSSDIVNRDDVPIWTIISNRYTISGLKRLFGNDLSKLKEADAPSEASEESAP